MPKESSDTNWDAVAAKALAYQAMHLAGLDEATTVDKAKFLMVLGLSRSDAAGLLRTSDEYLRKGFERAAKKALAKADGKAGTDGK